MTAPFAGKISGPQSSPGDVVVADTTVLATVTKIDSLSVAFDVSESTYLRLNRSKREGKLKSALEPDMLVQIGLGVDQGLRLKGKIYSVGNQINPVTSRIRCAASIPNADGLILPGMSAIVHLETSAPRRSVLVPNSALANTEGVYAEGIEPSLSVVVVPDGNAREIRSVKIGLGYDDSREVTAGLKAGEWIVIDRQLLQRVAGRKAEIEFEKVSWPGSGPSSEDNGSTR